MKFLLFLISICLMSTQTAAAATSADVLDRVLKFSDEEFYSSDPSFLAQRQSLLLDMDFSGIIINSPRLVSTEKRQKLPLIMAYRYDGMRDWKVSLQENCIVFASNLSDGTVRLGYAFRSQKEMSSRPYRVLEPRGEMPPSEKLASAAAKITGLDARSLLGIPWASGTWSLGILYYDWVSSTVTVKLVGGKEQRPVLPQTAKPAYNPKGAGTLPSYLQEPSSPKAPDSGLTFSIDASGGKQHLIVTGAFAVPVSAHHLPSQKMVHTFSDGRRMTVSAIIPITMVVLTLDSHEPIRFDWAIPVYGTGLRAGMTGIGYFAIDALAAVDTLSTIKAGHHVCYIILDGRVFGPVSCNMSG